MRIISAAEHPRSRVRCYSTRTHSSVPWNFAQLNDARISLVNTSPVESVDSPRLSRFHPFHACPGMCRARRNWKVTVVAAMLLRTLSQPVKCPDVTRMLNGLLRSYSQHKSVSVPPCSGESKGFKLRKGGPSASARLSSSVAN
ncbi:hypothetical protein DPEC_G00216980 [Dallia pectoralis]|uniref:Uncharacterized protein n=1 Tax=Dallia pectoralis TaxID=75939 RepID=A0ACC2G2N1_DALPE|nr:hypothetical protein DPEC_G00216980 [Dallia pectoralis]